MPRQTTRTHVASRARTGAAGVQLAWALDRAGAKVRAARLAPADRRARAPFTCLGCGEELVPHLGRIRTPHFAHRPGSSCPLTAPETALHLDAKERLLALCADAFAGRRRVVARARCPECRRGAPLELGALGDRARAEAAVGALRADVLVLAGDRPALAIEVLVTHAVEAEKEAALAAAGVPAIEVDAREEWERAEEDGTVEIACARSLGFPPCDACRTRARADAERDRGGEAAEIAELEGYRARGLLRPQPPRAGDPAPAGPDAALSAAEREAIAREFRCPDCGTMTLAGTARILRHACSGGPGGPGAPARPVAWRGYDGSVVRLGWWAPRTPAPPRGAATARARKPR
ncbi:MAG TPA: competence protein CoiA family protein [Anaeromyxobacter sp.]|nr:competence protein CoiA family protein [Anaeromyxobacter sp.]